MFKKRNLISIFSEHADRFLGGGNHSFQHSAVNDVFWGDTDVQGYDSETVRN